MNKYEKWAIVIIIIGTLLRFYLSFSNNVAGDGCWHSNVARYIAENREMPLYQNLGREPFWVPPLYHVLTAVAFSLFGSLNLISPLMGSLSLIVGYLILKELFDEEIAFYGLLFFTFIPNFIFHSSVPYIDTTMTFFVLLSLYFVIKHWTGWAGIAFGLAMLSKYNAMFAFPALIAASFIVKNKDTEHIDLLIWPFILGIGWYLKNFILFGNPVWPLGNKYFPNTLPLPHIESRFAVSNILNIQTLATDFFLSFFGVPNGRPEVFSYIPWEPQWVFILIWMLGCVFIFFFIMMGLVESIKYKDKKGLWILLALLGGYLIQHLLLIIDVSNFQARRMMPAFLTLSLFWAIGIKSVKKYFPKFNKLVWIGVIIVLVGLVSGEVIKNQISHNIWDSYQADFGWVKENTPSGQVILGPPSQCLPFHLDRPLVHYASRVDNFTTPINITKEYLIQNNITYVYITEGHQLIPDFNLTDRDLYDEILDSEVVYTNQRDTVIYKWKKGG